MTVFLTNIDLLKAAQKYNIPLRSVFSKDQPPDLSADGGYIVNLENSKSSSGARLPGSHWTAFWIERGNAVYFDSFGFPPSSNTQFILRKFVPYRYNKIQIQSVNSGICGYYALFFIWWMNHFRESIPNINTRFDKFIMLFNQKQPSKNRQILENLLEKYIRT